MATHRKRAPESTSASSYIGARTRREPSTLVSTPPERVMAAAPREAEATSVPSVVASGATT
jgi:hypothetical protein